jgi:hypothetical protein
MPLINNIDVLKRYVSLEKATDFDTIKPHLNNATEKYIVPMLGKEQVASLEAFVLAGDFGTTPTDLLLEKVRYALGPLTVYLGFPHLVNRVSDKGVNRSDSSDYTPSEKWAIDDQRNELLFSGMNALDAMVSYINDNIDEFSDYEDSDAYKKYNTHLVNSALIFNEYVEIRSSYWLYSRMLSEMSNVERHYIISSIGKDFYNELITASKDDATADEVKDVIKDLQRCISQFTYARALVSPVMRHEILVVSVSRYDEIKYPKSFYEAFEKEADEYMRMAQTNLTNLVAHLNANASDSLFETYFGSSLYVAPVSSTDTDASAYGNDEASGSFMFL